MIVTQDFFYGKLSIANASNGDVISDLQVFIDELEPKMLELLLGRGLNAALQSVGELGEELISNSGFEIDASGWFLGAGWSYIAGQVSFTPGAVTELKQTTVGAFAVPSCRVVIRIGGTTGFVVVSLGREGTNKVYDAGVDIVTFDGVAQSALGEKVILTPSPDFNGKIDYISMKEITNQRWLDLLNGKEYVSKETGSTERWKGLSYTLGTAKKSLIANYIYYYYQRNRITATTSSGEKSKTRENSKEWTPDPKLAAAWNEMVTEVKQLRDFLLSNAGVYPEYVDPFKTTRRSLSEWEKDRREIFDRANPYW